LDLFDEQYYTELEGGILEAFGKLFTTNLRIYVYPLLDQETGTLRTLDNLQMAPELENLYKYLVYRGMLKQLRGVDGSLLHIFSRDVLQRIKKGDSSWEAMVPAEIASIIKSRMFFGYMPDKQPARA
jgi:hypothetical protein